MKFFWIIQLNPARYLPSWFMILKIRSYSWRPSYSTRMKIFKINFGKWLGFIRLKNVMKLNSVIGGTNSKRNAAYEFRYERQVCRFQFVLEILQSLWQSKLYVSDFPYFKVPYLLFKWTYSILFKQALLDYTKPFIFLLQSPLGKLNSKDSFVCPVDYSLSIMNDDDVDVQILTSSSPLNDHEFLLT